MDVRTSGRPDVRTTWPVAVRGGALASPGPSVRCVCTPLFPKKRLALGFCRARKRKGFSETHSHPAFLEGKKRFPRKKNPQRKKKLLEKKTSAKNPQRKKTFVKQTVRRNVKKFRENIFCNKCRATSKSFCGLLVSTPERRDATGIFVMQHHFREIVKIIFGQKSRKKS